ncbi:MAG: MBOAT family O-acyltransferase, partial [Clostridia bacterium]|nr:MBOAT family O-acyltransferase [Clostridia bacterium]
FYMFWKPVFIVLLLASTGVDYFAAIMMSKTDDKAKRKKFLLLSLIVNLGLLGFFKYFGMLDSTAVNLFSSIGLSYRGTGWNILLPIGISFYTFQTIGYTIDVYRGTVKAERHFGYFALYVSFFPQLIAGPIERARNLLPQLKKKFNFDYAQSVEGMLLICWGFFKKTIIADRLAIGIDSVFAAPEKFSPVHLFISSFLFLYQLYFDFSSYTDIARGTAKILGIELMKNFNRPFAAKSISDLWSRWHISLTSWFASYVSVPLYRRFRKMNKKAAYILATIITLSLCGLWHGADWSFILWGAYIAVVMIIGNLTRRYRMKLKDRLGITKLPFLNRSIEIITVMILVASAMVLFRAPDMASAANYYANMLSPSRVPLIEGLLGRLNMTKIDLLIVVAGAAVVELVQYLGRKGVFFEKLASIKPVFRYSIYVTLIMLILVLGKFTGSPYIYFQF